MLLQSSKLYQRVITVGASVSAADTAVSLIDVAESPIHAVVRGRYNVYFGDEAFKHPKIRLHPPISHVSSSNGDRTVFFEDGTSVSDVDHIIFGTGYSWSLPFLPDVPVRNNRIPGLYLHIFYRQDPTLTFVGAVRHPYICAPYHLCIYILTAYQLGAGFTFKVFEWQAVLAARVLAGKAQLPPLEEQEKWEIDRVAEKGDGPAFTLLNPHFEEYFEQVRRLAGEPAEGEPGRRLPKFDPRWVDTFNAGNNRRIEMWKRLNRAAAEAMAKEKEKEKEKQAEKTRAANL